ncbi:MAG TPA: MFS transporter [Acidimicrobiia bacterium]|nr:MFS transporter [Acidimicrobiia bacterium]
MSTPLGRNYWKLWTASVISNFGDGVATVAYPWLASAVTRSPVHIALVTVATRLPWLLFSLPAGVITDRVDRKRLVVVMDGMRFVATLGVALVVFLFQGDLSSPDAIATGLASPPPNADLLLVAVYVAALLLGTAEVFRDNSAQTLMPSIVEEENLERANGRLWGAEVVMNSFAGPPAGGLLLAVAFSLPFFVDAATFAASAALILTIAGRFRPIVDPAEQAPRAFMAELKEGVRWLWRHDLFRPMAISLGVMNGMASLATATYVLFVQEILRLDAAVFGALLTAGAAGGVVGSLAAARLSKRIGQGASLFASILVFAVTLLVTGLAASFWVVWSMFAISSFFVVLWNVITVSLRQALIPDRMLGRVNSVYRFLGWGMIPVGSFLGGVVVAVAEPLMGREWALRIPFVFAAMVQAGLFVYARPRLNSAQIAEARASAKGQESGVGSGQGDD